LELLELGLALTLFASLLHIVACPLPSLFDVVGRASMGWRAAFVVRCLVVWRPCMIGWAAFCVVWHG
jgi:hypothetical protein